MGEGPTNEDKNEANSGKPDSPILHKPIDEIRVTEREETDSATQQTISQSSAQLWKGWESMNRMWENIKKTENTNLIMAIATVVIAIFTALTFWLVLDSSNDTGKLISAAQTQAAAATNISGAADDFKDSAYWMEQHMDDAANAIQDSVDTADRSTKATIRNAEKSFRDEQRAWIGLGQFRIDHFDDKDPFKLLIPWVNSGKTPAIKTESAIPYAFPPTRLTGPPAGYKYLFEKSSAIAPQGAFVITVTNSAVPPIYTSINDGTLWMYFYGQFRYRDIHSKTVHTTSFCLYYDRITKQMAFCENGNDMD